MQIDLLHEPARGPRPFVLRCRFGSFSVEVDYPTRDAAEAARPDFAKACREVFAS